MNISSDNFGHFRVTRHQNDAVTVLNTGTGFASNYPGGLAAYTALRHKEWLEAKSGDEYRVNMEKALRNVLVTA